MLTLTMLGTMNVAWNGAPLRLGNRKVEGLLAVLSLSDRPVAREELLRTVWGRSSSESTALHVLSQAVYTLRRLTERSLIRSTREALQLESTLTAVDVRKVERCLDDNDIAGLQRLYRGSFLAGFRLVEPEFEEWRDSVNRRLQLRIEDTCLAALRALEVSGQWPRVQRLSGWILEWFECVEAARMLVRSLAVAGLADRARLEAARLAESLGLDGAQARSLAEEARRPTAAPRKLHVATGSPMPFVGREQEMRLLTTALEDVRESGTSTAVIVLGEPGIGKSRLCNRFLRSAALAGARVFHGRCYESQSGIPYAAASELLNSAVREDEIDSLPGSWKAHVRDLVLGSRTAARHGGTIGDQRRTYEGIVRLLAPMAQERPLVVHLDDLQWADHSTVGLLKYLTRRLTDAPIVFLGAARQLPSLSGQLPDLGGGWSDETHVMRIGELDDRAVHELIERFERTHDLRLAASQKRAIHGMHGNPFLIAAALLTVAHPEDDSGNGVIDVHRPSMSAVLARLGSEAARCVSILALYGARAPLPLLQRMCGGWIDVERATAGATSIGLVNTWPDGVELSHDLLREEICRDMSPTAKRLAHHGIAMALEQGDAQPGVVAYHYAESGEPDAAFQYFLKASRGSEAVSAYEEAREYAELALRNASSRSRWGRAKAQVAFMCHRTGELDRADQLYKELEDEASYTNRYLDISEIQAARLQITAQTEKISINDVIKKIDTWLTTTLPENRPDLAVQLLAEMARLAQLACGEETFARSATYARRISEKYQGSDIGLIAQRLAAQIEGFFLNRRAGLRSCKHVESSAKLSSDIPAVWIPALDVLGSALLANGRLREARSTYQDTLGVAEESAAVEALPSIYNNLGVVSLELGQATEARAHFGRVRELAVAGGHRNPHALAIANLAIAHYEFDDFPRLGALCEDMLGGNAGLRSRMQDALAHALLGTAAYELRRNSQVLVYAQVIEDLQVDTRFFVSDASYIDIFRARALEVERGLDEALAFLERAARITARRHLLAWYRLLLERARMQGARDRRAGIRLAVKVRERARRIGAALVARRAERVLLELDAGVGESRRHRHAAPALAAG